MQCRTVPYNFTPHHTISERTTWTSHLTNITAQHTIPPSDHTMPQHTTVSVNPCHRTPYHSISISAQCFPTPRHATPCHSVPQQHRNAPHQATGHHSMSQYTRSCQSAITQYHTMPHLTPRLHSVVQPCQQQPLVHKHHSLHHNTPHTAHHQYCTA